MHLRSIFFVLIPTAVLAFELDGETQNNGDVLLGFIGTNITFPFGYSLGPDEEVTGVTWSYRSLDNWSGGYKIIAEESSSFQPRPEYVGRLESESNGVITLSRLRHPQDQGDYKIEVVTVRGTRPYDIKVKRYTLLVTAEGAVSANRRKRREAPQWPKECPVGTWWFDCRRKCNIGCKDDVCNIPNGRCLNGCKPGYKPGDYEECNGKCDPGIWGDQCQHNCSKGCSQDGCSEEDGRCSVRGCNDGYKQTEKCDELCPPNTFSGSFMNQDCKPCSNNNCANNTCHGWFGKCTLGCKPGYVVSSYRGLCLKECDKGRYGKDCAHTCGEGCKPGGCNHVTGACIDTSGCEVGWVKDALCNKACPKGRYGQDCVKTCSKGCKSGDCNAIDGVCKHGCLRGYYDEPMCNRVCAQGYWDKNCRYVCNAGCKGNKCNATTGQCGPCKPGWKHGQGGHCEEGYFYITKTFWVRSFKEKRNFFDAKRSCEEHAGHLVYPKTLLDLQKLFKKFVRYDWRPRYYGQVLSTAVWVGADDLAWEGDYRWLDGSPVDSSLFSDNKDDKNACYDLDHQRLYKGRMRYVNYGQNCAAFSETKHWYSTECCQRELPYICQWDPYDYNWPEN